MSAPAWMSFYPADYLADTGHLSTVEHGAYLLLIMHYWQNEGLPDDDRKLARIARMSMDEWDGVRDTIAEFFDDGWRHGRIDHEITTAQQTISKRSAAGKAGAKARYSKRMANADQSKTIEITAAQQTDAPNGAGAGKETPTLEREASPRAKELDDLENRLREAAGLENDPSPGLFDLSPITALRDKGYPMETIIGKLREAKAKGRKGRSWRYYLPAIEDAHTANSAIPENQRGRPAEVETTWITQDDARWPDLANRWREEKGRAPPATGSKQGEAGIGWHFPSDWISSKEIAA